MDSTEINQIYEQVPVCNISATYFVSYGSQDPRLDIFSILQMCVNQNKYLSHKSSKTGCSQAYARNLDYKCASLDLLHSFLAQELAFSISQQTDLT